MHGPLGPKTLVLVAQQYSRKKDCTSGKMQIKIKRNRHFTFQKYHKAQLRRSGVRGNSGLREIDIPVTRTLYPWDFVFCTTVTTEVCNSLFSYRVMLMYVWRFEGARRFLAWLLGNGRQARQGLDTDVTLPHTWLNVLQMVAPRAAIWSHLAMGGWHLYRCHAHAPHSIFL